MEEGQRKWVARQRGIDGWKTINNNMQFLFKLQLKCWVRQKNIVRILTFILNENENDIVASTGIEPVSGASEALILSIVLRGHRHFGFRILDLRFRLYR